MSYDVDALRRVEFPWALAGDTVYLNNASTGPLPERTVRVATEWARLRATPHGHTYLDCCLRPWALQGPCRGP